jgi:hypothetical protein
LLFPRLGSLSLYFFIHAFLILRAHRSISAEEEEEEEEEEAVAQRLKSPASKASNHDKVQAMTRRCKAFFDA